MSLIGILGCGFGVVAPTTVPDVGSDLRDRATQEELLRQTARRLRGQVRGFSDANCIVTDQEQPESWASGNVVCTVCAAAGKFPEAFYAGGGVATLCEVTTLKGSVFVRCKLDKPPTAEAWL